MSIQWQQWAGGEWAGYVNGQRIGDVWFYAPGLGEWQGFILLHAREHGLGDYDVKVTVSRDSPKNVMTELDRLYEKFKAMMEEVKAPAHE